MNNQNTIERQKRQKYDIQKWLLEEYENHQTHYDLIETIYDKIISFITSYGFSLNVEPPVFKSRLITFLYHNSSHKRYSSYYELFNRILS